MPGILKTIQDAVPFLQAYPPSVRAFIAVGLVIICLTAALMVAVLIWVPRTQTPVGFPDTAPTPSSAPPTQPDTSTTLPAQPVPSPVIAPQETPPAAPEPQVRSPVTLPDLLNTLNAEGLTDLQKQAFRDKHRSKIVEWQAYVVSVQPEDSYTRRILALISLNDPRTHLPRDLVPVWFSPAHKSDLLDLAVGDLIRILATLDFKGGINTEPSLHDASVLHHEKAGRVA